MESAEADTEVFARDGIELVNRFAAKGSTHFKNFQEEWQDSKFYYIHCLGQDDTIKNLITEVVCSAMTSIVVDKEKPLLERLGAVYTWYAMYNTQSTTATPVNIRLNQSDWLALSSFQQQLKDISHADYIIDKLHSSFAFHLCYGRRRFYPGLHREAAARDAVNSVKQHLLKEESPLIQTSLKGAEQLHKQYAVLKESLKEHLPPHLLDSFGFGNLLTRERIEEIAQPPASSQDEEEEPATAPVVAASRGTRKRRRRVLENAYCNSPSTSWR